MMAAAIFRRWRQIRVTHGVDFIRRRLRAYNAGKDVNGRIYKFV